MLAILAATLLAAPQPSLSDYDPPPAGQVRITRDRYGVPHIIAADAKALFFGVGYAQAEDQIENLAKSYLRAAGRLAEVEGERELALDKLVRALRMLPRAQQGLAELDPEIRHHFDAFAAGVNAYVAEHRDEVPAWVQPVTAADALAFGLVADLMFVVHGGERELRGAGKDVKRIVGWPKPLPENVGSNQLAIGPERSASGAAILSIDPHLPLSGMTRCYEMHLVAPGVNVMGATFFGLPYVIMGRTLRTAWSMTVNGCDLADWFAMPFDQQDRTRVKTASGFEPLVPREETFKVRVEDGFDTKTVKFYDTSLGPVLAESPTAAYAFALPFPSSLRVVRQSWDMACAQDLPAFKRALAQLGITMFNIMYADADGRIFYVCNQRSPVRDLRIDSRAIRPADQEWAQWRGYHAFTELPQLEDPPAGFMLNANSGLHSVCPGSPLRRAAFPAYMDEHEANTRSRRLTKLLRGDESVTWEEVHAYATDTYIESADQWVPMATGLIERHLDDFDGDRDVLTQCAEVLTAWDRRCDQESRGAVLFAYLAMDRGVAQAIGGSGPDWRTVFPAVLQVAGRVRTTFGALDAPWSAFSRLKRGAVELPCNGHGSPGAVAVRPTSGRIAADGKRYAEMGSSYSMVVDFAGATRSSSCLPFGISDDPESAHYADQMPFYCRGEHKPAWFLPAELAEHTASNRVLNVKD